VALFGANSIGVSGDGSARSCDTNDTISARSSGNTGDIAARSAGSSSDCTETIGCLGDGMLGAPSGRATSGFLVPARDTEASSCRCRLCNASNQSRTSPRVSERDLSNSFNPIESASFAGLGGSRVKLR